MQWTAGPGWRHSAPDPSFEFGGLSMLKYWKFAKAPTSDGMIGVYEEDGERDPLYGQYLAKLLPDDQSERIIYDSIIAKPIGRQIDVAALGSYAPADGYDDVDFYMRVIVVEVQFGPDQDDKSGYCDPLGEGVEGGWSYKDGPDGETEAGHSLGGGPSGPSVDYEDLSNDEISLISPHYSIRYERYIHPNYEGWRSFVEHEDAAIDGSESWEGMYTTFGMGASEYPILFDDAYASVYHGAWIGTPP
jgi:hypothetical protein